MILVLAFVTATFSPAAPTVGDPITIVFSEPVKVAPSPAYDVIAQQGRRVVVRTFVPKPFVIGGVTIPVRSVLKKNDDLQPAPLTPPRASAYPRAPFVAIAIAALLAAGAWLVVWLLAKRAVPIVEPVIPASERYRGAVLALRENPARADRWAALADATRAYLADVRAGLGSDLTTTELVPRLVERERVVADILRQGDMEKFSGEGAPPRDFDEVADRALELAS